jgi:hypothetical protein
MKKQRQQHQQSTTQKNEKLKAIKNNLKNQS